MTDTFVASNGVTLDRYGLAVGAPGIGLLVELFNSEGAHPARIEFYRHLEDERLGRWRWPENPDYVVYPLGLDATDRRYAAALHEPSGITGRWQEGQYRTVPPTEATDLGILAVAAYFDAHPEPKPWHAAKPGEVWAVTKTIADEEHACRVARVNDEIMFEPTIRPTFRFAVTSTVIASARRIWPEDAS